MSKKGFTLVELLAVIVILALLISLSVMGVTAIRNNSLQKIVDTKLADLQSSAVLYGQENQEELTDTCTVSGESYSYCLVVTASFLVEEGYYKVDQTDDSVLTNNLTNKSMLCNTYQIYRKNNRIYATLLQDYSIDGCSCNTSTGTGVCS